MLKTIYDVEKIFLDDDDDDDDDDNINNNYCEVGDDGKDKVIPVLLTKHHAMKTYWGSRCIAPPIL
jgi:hypothetical protein